MVRLASSILKALSRSGSAAASSASAAGAEGRFVGARAAQRGFGRMGAPRLVRDAAQRQPHVADRAVGADSSAAATETSAKA